MINLFKQNLVSNCLKDARPEIPVNPVSPPKPALRPVTQQEEQFPAQKGGRSAMNAGGF